MPKLDLVVDASRPARPARAAVLCFFAMRRNGSCEASVVRSAIRIPIPLRLINSSENHVALLRLFVARERMVHRQLATAATPIIPQRRDRCQPTRGRCTLHSQGSATGSGAKAPVYRAVLAPRASTRNYRSAGPSAQLSLQRAPSPSLGATSTRRRARWGKRGIYIYIHFIHFTASPR